MPLGDRAADSLPALGRARVEGNQLTVIVQQKSEGFLPVTLPNDFWIDTGAGHFFWFESLPEHVWRGLAEQLSYCLDLAWLQQLCRPISLVGSNILATHAYFACERSILLCAACNAAMHAIPICGESGFSLAT